MAQCPEGSSPPTRANKHRRVLFIHGYPNNGSSSCSETWTDAINYFDAAGWGTSQLTTVASGHRSGSGNGCSHSPAGRAGRRSAVRPHRHRGDDGRARRRHSGQRLAR
jgi:hypothetical protein